MPVTTLKKSHLFRVMALALQRRVSLEIEHLSNDQVDASDKP